jgi:hypothetical protein
MQNRRMDARAEAEAMLAVAARDEQCVRRIESEDDATRVRLELRRLARRDGVHMRTARIRDTVVVVRLDAAVWHEDTATMRRKLTPAEPAPTGR